MLHHCNPTLSICEAFTSRTIRPILSHLPDLVNVLKTADCIIWCADEQAKQIAEETRPDSEDIRVGLRHLTQSVARPQAPLPTTDLIIMNLDSSSSGDTERILRNARGLLGSDGRLCLIVPDNESDIAETRRKSVGLFN